MAPKSKLNLKIEYVPIGSIKPYKGNAKLHPQEQIDQIKRSIELMGFNDPIAIWKNGEIIEGHGRLIAAQQIGMETVPIIRLDDLTDEQRRSYALIHNKLTMNSGFDAEVLALELAEIDEIDMESFSFLPYDLFAESKVPQTEDEMLEQKKREFEERMKAGELSEDSEEYQEFLAKFEAKKTTDDCYTPPKVYYAVADYVAKKYGLKKTSFVRPFVPGGDYEHFNYPKGCAVVDNPPFSILAEILNFYKKNGIKFFLFAPALTLFSSSSSAASALCTGVGITYENGALVNTSFLTNLEPEELRFRSAPELYAAVKQANEENLKTQRKEIPKYSYPLEVVTAPMLTSYSRYGIEFSVNRDESYQISALDSQKESKKTVFGKGYLISARKKAEREKAERWELSDREIEIISSLR